MNVRVRQQAQSLQSLERSHRGSERRNRCGIKNIAPLHGCRHVQMMLDQKSHFGFFFRHQFEPRCRTRQRRQTSLYMIFHRHSLARVVQQQRENQQVAALLHFPYGSELCSSRIGRLRQCLQVFNRAQRMFVHRIAMIEIAHHQRIDRAQLRQDFHQYPQSMHGPQRHTGIVRRKNFF